MSETYLHILCFSWNNYTKTQPMHKRCRRWHLSILLYERIEDRVLLQKWSQQQILLFEWCWQLRMHFANSTSNCWTYDTRVSPSVYFHFNVNHFIFFPEPMEAATLANAQSACLGKWLSIKVIRTRASLFQTLGSHAHRAHVTTVAKQLLRNPS